MLIGIARHRSRVHRWPATALLGSAIWLGAGCSLLEPPPYPGAEPATPEISVPEPSVPEPSLPDRPDLEDAEKLRARQEQRRKARESAPAAARETQVPDPGDDRLVLGQRREGSLHCGKKKCHEQYTLEVPKRGRLEVDVRAPGGEGLPDLGVLLEDAQGELLGASVRPQERPRIIRKQVEPGTYQVQIYALGSSGDIASYDVSAKLEKQRLKRRRPAKKKSRAKPAPQFRVVKSEVLEVERDGGEPAFVLIEAGKNLGIEVGFGGALVDNGKPIGKIEVVEVFPDGSRVRILDRLSAPITIATKAEINVPK